MQEKRFLHRWDAFLESIRDLAASHADYLADAVSAIEEAKAGLEPLAREIQSLSHAQSAIPQELYLEYSAKVRFLEVMKRKADLLADEMFWAQLNDNMDMLLMCLDDSVGPEFRCEEPVSDVGPAVETETRLPVSEDEVLEFQVKRSVEEILRVIQEYEYNRLNKYEQVAVLAGMLFGTEWFESVECKQGIETTLGLEHVFSIHMALQYCSVTMESPTLMLRSEAQPDDHPPGKRNRVRYRYLVSDVTVAMIKKLIFAQIQPKS